MENDLNRHPRKISIQDESSDTSHQLNHDHVSFSGMNSMVTPEKHIDIDIEEVSMDDVSDNPKKDKANKKSFRDRLKLSWPPGKKEYGLVIILIIAIVALVIGLGDSKKKDNLASLKKVSIPQVAKSDLVASTLSGLPVQPSVNQTPVTGVMIENSEQARPQSGLGSASVVFEALAEGGITRFLALYQDTSPDNVGPIRSLRPYYLQWALGFDASIAHVGGSPDALADVSTWHAQDLNEFYNGSYYHRITSRQAPHNVYTSIADLNKLEDNKGYTTTSFTGFPRKAAQPSKDPSATTIKLNLSGADYNVQYSYSATSNSYNRSEGGAPQIDANTNQQISPKVVIAIVTPLSQGALDASGAYYSDYNVLGSGAAYVFQDGNVTVGQWTKTSNTSQITFTDSTGNSIKLDPGQTWITAISSSNEVSY